ncbi:MAG: interleukin-like EMT inducer domain-containing protein, partial [Romboutsia sp.]
MNIKNSDEIYIVDYNDITTGRIAPDKPVKDQMWLDTSSNPSILKSYDGVVWETVNDIKIGGRNLALKTDSKTYNGFKGIVNDCQIDHDVILSMLRVGDYVSVSYVFSYKDLIKSKGHNDSGIWLQGCGDITSWSSGCFNGGDRLTNRIEWGTNHSGDFKVEYTFKVTEDMKKNNKWSTNFRMDFIESGEVSVKYFKVEKGNKCTDYTKAPEDIDDAINNVEKVTETNRTKLDVQQGLITANIERSKIIEGKQKTLEDNYNKTTVTINSINNVIGQQKTVIDNATGKITNVEVKTNTIEKNLNGVNQTLQDISKTVTNNKTITDNKTSELKQNIDGLNANITSIKKITDGEIESLNSTTANLKAGIQGIGAKLTTVEQTTQNINNSKEDKNYRVIYAKGIGNDYSSTPVVKVGNTVITNGHGRGLQIVVLNPITLNQEFKQDYDTYAGGQAITDFVNKINSLNDENHIIIITSFDSSTLTNASICEALYKVGGYSAKPSIASYREAYALIGKSKLGKSNGIEMYIPKTINDKRYAEVSVKVGEDGTFLGHDNIGFGQIIDEANSNITQLTNKTITHDTEIKAIKGEVSSKVSETTLSNTVKTINDNIKITTDKTIENASQLKQTKDSIQASVNSLNSKTETITSTVKNLNSDLTNKIDGNLTLVKKYANDIATAKSELAKQQA